MIPENILNKYGMNKIDNYIKDFGNTTNTQIMFYDTFLNQTDYICNKIVEGVATWDDYPEEKKYRQIARDEINKLRK